MSDDILKDVQFFVKSDRLEEPRHLRGLWYIVRSIFTGWEDGGIVSIPFRERLRCKALAWRHWIRGENAGMTSQQFRNLMDTAKRSGVMPVMPEDISLRKIQGDLK